MAASGEEHYTGHQGADTAFPATQLRLRAEARQRRLLLSRASRRLQVIGGCSRDGASGAGYINQCDAHYEQKQLRSVSPPKCRPTGDDTISGRSEASHHETVPVESPTEALVTQSSAYAEDEPCVVSTGPRLRAQPTGSSPVMFMVDDAVAKRMHVGSVCGRGLGTDACREPKNSVSFGNADSKGKGAHSTGKCTVPTRTVTSPSQGRRRIPVVAGYLALRGLTSIRSQLIQTLKVLLNALHANLCLLRRLYVSVFIILAVISALLPRAALPEGPIPAFASGQENARLPTNKDGLIYCFIRHVVVFFASRPLFCIIWATCIVLLVEHAPTVVEEVCKMTENDRKLWVPQESSLSPSPDMQHRKGELMQHQENSRSYTTSNSRTGVCPTISHERVRPEETRPVDRTPRVDYLYAVLSKVFLLFQCYATLLRVIQLLATFVVLHCITRLGLVRVAIFAGCGEPQMLSLFYK